jgi:hypothetical protein
VQQFIDDQYDLIISCDHNGINSGVWLMKNSSWSHTLLDRWWSSVQYIKPLDKQFTSGSGDQDALGALLFADAHANCSDALGHLSTFAQGHVKFVPQCAFNSYMHWHGDALGIYTKGDFLVHFAGDGVPQVRLIHYRQIERGMQF